MAASVGVAIADTPEPAEAGRYIVQLAEPPLATYQGAPEGWRRPATTGDHIDPAAAVAAYGRHRSQRPELSVDRGRRVDR